MLVAGVTDSYWAVTPAPFWDGHAACGASLAEALATCPAVVLPLRLLEQPLTTMTFLQNGQEVSTKGS